jgi:hypothetical protein
MKKIASLAFTAFLASAYAGPEPLRLSVPAVITVSEREPEGQKAVMGFTDAVGILVDGSPFIEAIEFELKIPPEAIKVPGSFAFAVYRNCKPLPSAKVVDYSADQVMMNALPGRLSFVLQVPLRKDHGLKPNPYAVISPEIIPRAGFPALFRILPAMKGFSPELEKAKFTLRAKPVFIDEGIVKLSFKFPESAGPKPRLTVTFDDRPLEDPLAPIQAKTGKHEVRVTGEGFMDENRTVTIERAKTQEVEISLSDTTPVIYIEAPETTQVWIDGEKVEAKGRISVPTVPGDHVVTFKVGDYTLTRKITVQKGRTYRVILSVDITVQEE